MPCKRPKYKSKTAAKKHGAITYGSGNYVVYPVKGGFKVKKK